jgi:hypothetical protein
MTYEDAWIQFAAGRASAIWTIEDYHEKTPGPHSSKDCARFADEMIRELINRKESLKKIDSKLPDQFTT